MEGLLNNPEFSKSLLNIGIFAIAHTIIFTHRIIRRKIHNHQYNQVSLMIEHVVSYATKPLFFNAIFEISGANSDIWTVQGINVDLGSISSLVYGLIADGLTPRRPQLDQITADITGIGLYLASKLVL